MSAGKQARSGVLALAVSLAIPISAWAEEAPPAPSVEIPGAPEAPPPGPAAQPNPGYPANPPPGSTPPGSTPPGSTPPGTYPPGTYPPSYPPPPYMVPVVVNLHDGFYLRLHVGGGYMNVSGSDGFGNTLKISGDSVSLGVSIGGAVATDFIVFGTFFASVLTNPDVTENGTFLGTGTGTGSVGGFGAGVAYYFQPINLYLSGALSALVFEVDNPNDTTAYDSDVGLGFQGMIGKEWWVSQDWGLGVAGELVLGSMKDKNDSTVRWTSTSLSLLFSATYN